jgi:hypothetical protein
MRQLLTKQNKLTVFFALALLYVQFCTQANAAENDTILALTGNDIIRCAGHGDTIWLVTPKGINVTYTTSDTLSFWGIKSDLFSWSGSAALAFADGKALSCLNSIDDNGINLLWSYNHSTKKYYSTKPAFPVALFSLIPDTLKESYPLLAIDAARYKNESFFACKNGGLLKLLSDSTGTGTIFLPGQKSAGTFAIENFPFDKKELYEHPDMAVISVSAPSRQKSGPLFVAQTRRIWAFSVADTLWTLLDTQFVAGPYIISSVNGLFVRDSATILASLSVHKPNDATSTDSLYQFDFAVKKWVAKSSGHPQSLTFGSGDTVYMSTRLGVAAYRLDDLRNPILTVVLPQPTQVSMSQPFPILFTQP